MTRYLVTKIKKTMILCGEKNKKKNYSKSFSFMINSLKKIARFCQKHKIKVAIETEGSYEKKDLLLMQKPSEYIEFFKHFKKMKLVLI